MYVPPNKYESARTSLGDMSGVFSKLKKFVEKIHPKELSPTRLLQEAQKKKQAKAAAKLQAAETQRATANEQAQAQTAAQIQALQATTPTGFSAPGISQP